jgi:uncharacterized repeat protein (TIGR01451 family)
MPHSFFAWPNTGIQLQSHASPPGMGYYRDWDPWSIELEVTPVKDVNPVRTQHIMVATVKDKKGRPLPNRRVEWILSRGGVGDIVEIDESGYRKSRGYKVDNQYAVTHTNNFDHEIPDGKGGTIQLKRGQTWCVITSPVEGDTHITVYAPGIHNRMKHKVFAMKHWYDVKWSFPPPATNPCGVPHEFVTHVMKYSDDTPLEGYMVNYEITSGTGAVLEPGGGTTASVVTGPDGSAPITIRPVGTTRGTAEVSIEIIRPADIQCCKPAAQIATGYTSKTWMPPSVSISKSVDTAKARQGDTVNYTITVSNDSSIPASNVVVSDMLPSGLSYVSSSPAGAASGNSMSWSLGTLSGSQSINVQARVTATEGTITNCAEVRGDCEVSDRDCVDFQVGTPVISIEKECPDRVTACDTINYTLVVRNSGSYAAENVEITDQLPDGIVTENGRRTVVVPVGRLEPGQARRAPFTARAERAGTFTNTATVTADGGLSDSASCTTVVTQPVLSVIKTGPSLRYLGRPATWDITVTNSGDVAANNTMLTDNLPAGVQFGSASDNGSASGGTVTWNLGTLQPGASRTVSVDVTCNSAGTHRNTVTARATCAEASAEAVLEVKGIPAVLLEVIDQVDPVELGTNTTYEITVTNQGSAVDTNIAITCQIQPEASFVSARGATNGTAENRTVRFAPLPSLAPGAQAKFYVTIRGDQQSDSRFRVSMDTDETESEVEESEATRIY